MMHNIIQESIKLNSNEPINYSPFLLGESDDSPTYFEMVFLIDNIRYRYGFEYTENEIVKEWLLFRKGSGKENYYFLRESGTIFNNTNFKEGKDKESQTNKNRLFLSLVAQLGGKISNSILNWFDSFDVISGTNENVYAGYSMSRFKYNQNSKENNNLALEFFRKLTSSPLNLVENSTISKELFLYSTPTTQISYSIESGNIGEFILDFFRYSWVNWTKTNFSKFTLCFWSEQELDKSLRNLTISMFININYYFFHW